MVQDLINSFHIVVEFLSSLLDWVLLLFSKCVEWFLDAIKLWIDFLLTPLVALIPDFSPYFSYLSVIAPYWNFACQWVALDVALYFLGAYFSFIVVMITVKLIIKLFIPTVG